MKKLLMLIVVVTGCATESGNAPTQNFCSDGDTECVCRSNPGLPECGDQPNPPPGPSAEQSTADFATGVVHTVVNPNRVQCSMMSTQHDSSCHWSAEVAGVTYRVTCTYTYSPGANEPGSPPWYTRSCTWDAGPA